MWFFVWFSICFKLYSPARGAAHARKFQINFVKRKNTKIPQENRKMLDAQRRRYLNRNKNVFNEVFRRPAALCSVRQARGVNFPRMLYDDAWMRCIVFVFLVFLVLFHLFMASAMRITYSQHQQPTILSHIYFGWNYFGYILAVPFACLFWRIESKRKGKKSFISGLAPLPTRQFVLFYAVAFFFLCCSSSQNWQYVRARKRLLWNTTCYIVKWV